MSRSLKIGNSTLKNTTGILESLIKNKTSKQRVINALVGRHFYGLVDENNLVSMCQENNKNICEVITDFPCRVYFDVDGKPDLNLDTVKKVITKYFGDVKMYVMGYESDVKHSYHITLNQYLTSVEDQLFLKNIVATIITNDCKYFDGCVYGKNRGMKCVYQSKPDGEQQLPISGTHGLTKFFIGSFLPVDTPSFNNSTLPDVSKDLKHIVKSYPNQTWELPTHITMEHLQQANELLKITPMDSSVDTSSYRWYVMGFCYNNGVDFNTFLAWYSTMKPEVPTWDSRVKKLNASWNDKLPSVTMNQYRHKLSQFYPDMIESNIHTSRFINMFDLSKYHPKTIGRIEQSHYEVKKKALVFNIGMGGGKTTTTLQYLQNHADKSFVWLAPRQTLVLNTSFRMKNEFKIEHVTHLDAVEKKNKGMTLKTASRLIICNQSLHYLDKNQDFKIVVIDEIETVLNSWKDDETHKDNLGPNFKIFIDILRRAEKVILLDAFTTTKTFSLLESLGITDVRLYTSEYRPVQKTLKHYPDINLLIGQICDEITSGKKLYIFYAFKNGTSKRQGIQDLDQRIKGHYNAIKKCEPKSILYFAESSAKNQLGNINESWAEANYVITTSSITVGVNYEGKDFDKVYMFCSGYANQPRDVIQSSMRVRYPKESEFGIHFFDHTNEEMTKLPAHYIAKACPIYNKLIDGVVDELQCDFDDSLRKFCELTNYQLGDVKKCMTKKTNISNEYFESKMLLEYTKVPTYDMPAAGVAESNIYNRTATLVERLALDKFYFDYNFREYTADNRMYIWNMNQRKFFKNLDHPLINMIEEANGCKLYDLNLDAIKVNDEVTNYIATHYKVTKIKNIALLLVKAINEIVGNMITAKKTSCGKHRGFAFSEEFLLNVEIMLSVELARAKKYVSAPAVQSDLDYGVDMTTVDETDEDQRYIKLKAIYDARYAM